MATEKQIAANRQNAKSSTGPRTDHGKRRSRRNAIRHGLTAETVIDVLEDPAAYKALQRAIHADYRPSTNFELELVARLVSLLWRLRRAVAIESGILAVQTTHLRKGTTSNAQYASDTLGQFYALIPALTPRSQFNCDHAAGALSGPPNKTVARSDKHTVIAAIANSFLKTASREGVVFDRLGRYEIRLWRQAVQTILLLNTINRTPRDDAKSYRRRPALSRHTLWPPFSTSDTDLEIS
jgi:hypothetical protein